VSVSRIVSLAVLSVAACCVIIAAQPQVPKGKYTSPPAAASVVIAGKKISVDYYAPSMHGRKIMGGLVPFGEVWCTGANYATKITTESDIQLGELKLPKGAYSIWTIPNVKQWTLIINKETGQFHLYYKQPFDFGRTPMTVKKLDSPAETFRVDVRDNGGNKGTLALIWETTEASVPLTVLQ
jgi:hypothetical protein